MKESAALVNLREQKRLELRKSDGLVAFIFNEKQQKIPVTLFNLSIRGICVLVSGDAAENYEIGGQMALQIEEITGKSYLLKALVRWKSRFKNRGMKYGLEVIRENTFPMEPVKSIPLPDSFPLMGAIYKPYLFYERTTFRLLQISPHYWIVKVFDTELFAFEGTELNLHFNTTLESGDPVKGIIFGVLDCSEDAVILALKISELPSSIEEWIGQQLIFNCQISPLDVRCLGLKARNVSNGFIFRFVKTQEEYEEVLKLRFQAYREAGKVSGTKTYKDMAATLDHLSRILAVYHGSKLVGSIAIAFPDSEDIVLDTEKAFSNGYPKKIPAKQSLIEIARLCTHPDYRKTDLLNRIFEYTYKTLHCGGRDYILTSTDSTLWPLYKKLGFKKTGMKYSHPYLAGVEHEVILGTKETPDKAWRISPLIWNYVWRDMNQFLFKNEQIQITKMQKAFLAFYRILGRILKINLKKRY